MIKSSNKMKDNIKLNLGAGHDHRSGWINADIDPQTKPEIILDLQAGLPFASGSVDQILLQDVLEHLTKQQAENLLAEIYRVLKPEARLELRFPNLEQIIDQFGDDPEVMYEFIYGTSEHNGLWGVHKYGYNGETIERLLRQFGYHQIEVGTETTNFVVTARSRAKLPEMKLFIVQQSPAWGGAEEWMSQVVSKLIANHRVDITTSTNHPTLGQRFSEVGAGQHHLPYILDIIGNTRGLIKSLILWPLATIFYLRLLFRAKRDGVNLILMSGFSEKLLVTWLARLFAIPVVWYEYGPLEPVFAKHWGLPKILYRLTKDLPKKVLTISQNTKNKLIPATRISLAKLKVIYPGVEIPASSAHGDKWVVGTLSRLVEEKGLIMLLDAWEEVVKKLPQAKLRIAGEGPSRFQLEARIEEKRLSQSVELVGFVRDKAEFYGSLKYFVNPASWEMEGFGLVNIEAMSFGLPVVAFDLAPGNEIISADTGKLIDSVSKQALAQGLVEILSSSEADKRGKQARAVVESKFEIDQQIEKLYQELYRVVCQYDKQ